MDPLAVGHGNSVGRDDEREKPMLSVLPLASSLLLLLLLLLLPVRRSKTTILAVRCFLARVSASAATALLPAAADPPPPPPSLLLPPPCANVDVEEEVLVTRTRQWRWERQRLLKASSERTVTACGFMGWLVRGWVVVMGGGHTPEIQSSI